METKLTLKMEEKLLRKAQILAKIKGVTLPQMVVDYLNSIVALYKKAPAQSLILSEITGVLHLDTDKRHFQANYKRHLEEKYL